MTEGLDLERVARSFTSRYWRWEIRGDEPVEATVEAELVKRLPHIDAASCAARFELGGVYLAGRPARMGQPVQAPCRFEYYEPRVSIDLVAASYPAWSPEDLLYADEDLAVVVKPAGLPSTPARDQAKYHLQKYLEEHFSQKVHLPSRLDMGVTGVVLVSLSTRMNRYLQRAYDARRIEKYYLCEVSREPPWSETSCAVSLERDPRHPVLRRCALNPAMGESAVTRIRKLATRSDSGPTASLLQAEPLTGRTHQIRVHCQSLGLPIVGDPYYQGVEASELRLVSFALRFFHPYKATYMEWKLPTDRTPAWIKNYSGCEIHYR